MTVLYESAAGGRVEKEYDYTSAKEAQNLEAAKILADLGKRVVLLRTSKTKGAKSADARIDGEKWEIKSPNASALTANAETVVDSCLKKAGRQAKNVIFHDKSSLNFDILRACINKRLFLSKSIEKICIIKGKTAYFFSRQEAIAWYFDMKIKELVDKMRRKNK